MNKAFEMMMRMNYGDRYDLIQVEVINALQWASPTKV